MYRRKWSDLPPDPVFEPDLSKLGYFINNIDEIRSIEEPRNYFNFFINKNARWNERQRFALHEALEKIVHARLEATGLTKLRLPLPDDALVDADQALRPHVPIFASSDIGQRSRVVVLVGESIQDLGVLAYRVVCGPGGVDAGSVVPIAKLVAAQRSSALDASPPGLILANTGQLWWWAEGGRALNSWSRDAVPAPSAVSWGYKTVPEVNFLPGNANPRAHVRHMLDVVVPRLVRTDAKIDIVAVADGCDHVCDFLGQERNWAAWEPRLNSLALVDSCFDATRAPAAGFQEFLRRRGRAYNLSSEPLDTPICNEYQRHPGVPEYISTLGCPVFSAGEDKVSELMLIKATEAIFRWVQRVAIHKHYRNPSVVVAVPTPSPAHGAAGGDDGGAAGTDGGGWGGVAFAGEGGMLYGPDTVVADQAFIDGEDKKRADGEGA